MVCAVPSKLVLIAASLFAWLALLAFTLPYDPDEAVYRIIARGIVEGRWPYRDLFDHKPPLLYGIYLPAGLGANIEAMRLIAAGFVVASLAPLWCIARQWLDERERMPAMVAYALVLANPFFIMGANAEAFMLLPLTASVAAPTAFIAGVLFGVTLAIKPVAVVFLPLLLVIWKRESWQSVAGAALVIAGISLFFVPIWGDYWDANVAFNLEYAAHASRSWSRTVGLPAAVFLASAAVWIAGTVGFLPRPYRHHLALWLGTSLLAAKATGYGYAHYYVLLAPPLALLAGRGWIWLLDRQRPVFTFALIGIGMVCAASSIAGLVFASGLRDEDRALSAAIRARSGEFYLAGNRSQLYATAGRQPDRRFFFSVPLAINGDWERRTLRELAACPATQVALVKPGRGQHVLDWSAQLNVLYRVSADFENAVLYWDPLRVCDSARTTH